VQGGQDAPIDVIDLDGPNILRRPCCCHGRSRQSF